MGPSLADGPRSSGVDKGRWTVRRAGFARAGDADDCVVAGCAGSVHDDLSRLMGEAVLAAA